MFCFRFLSDIWEKKPHEKTVKAPCLKTKDVKRPAKRKATEPIGLDLDDDPDEPDVEVELDSLGSFSYTSLTMIFIRMTPRAAKLTTQR